jgi:hypothetical protein
MAYEPEHRDPYALAMKIALGGAIAVIVTMIAWPFFVAWLAYLEIRGMP